MFALDNTTIIISAVLIIIALLTSFLNPFFRKVRIEEYDIPNQTKRNEDTYNEVNKVEENKEMGVDTDIIN